MKTSQPKNRLRGHLKGVALVTTSLCLIAVSAFGLIRQLDLNRQSYGSAQPPEPIDLSAQPAAVRAEVELITLTANGFEPSELSRSSGRFLINLINRSGLAQPSLVIERQDRRVEARKLLTREKVWRRAVNLAPGTYILREATHPEWECRVTLTSN